MARLTLLLTVLFLAIGSFAQVVVTDSGFATQSGPAIPATPVSPPIIYTPIIQLGQAPTQPMRAVAPPDLLPQTGGQQVFEDNTPSTGVMVGRNTPFNFGVAQFDSGMGSGSVGEDINGKSLGELAREQRQHPVGTNARIYSNSDIDKLNQVGNAVSTPSTQANNTNDNWSPNNGIITPENSQPAPNSVASPAQPTQSTPTANHNPFAPKPQSQASPTGIDMTPNQPQTRTPQSGVRPFAKREGPEMAQNNPESGPLAQEDRLSNAANDAPAQNQPQAAQLPRTASRLPLVGVAGLFSVSLGIFVRYQRAKAR